MSKKSRARKAAHAAAACSSAAAHHSERKIAIVTEGYAPDIVTLDSSTPAKAVILCFDDAPQLQRARVALEAAMQELSQLESSEREQLIREFYGESE